MGETHGTAVSHKAAVRFSRVLTHSWLLQKLEDDAHRRDACERQQQLREVCDHDVPSNLPYRTRRAPPVVHGLSLSNIVGKEHMFVNNAIMQEYGFVSYLHLQRGI